MIQAQIKRALQGGTRAFEVVMDRAYGKPKSAREAEFDNEFMGDRTCFRSITVEDIFGLPLISNDRV